MEFVGFLFFLSLGLGWIATIGHKTATALYCAAALITQGLLTFGKYALLGLRNDEVTYFSYASDLSVQLILNPWAASTGFSEGKEAYVWILGFVFVMFGESPIPPLMFGVLCTSLIPTLMVSASRNFGLASSGRVTGWLSVFSPPLVLWLPGLTREAPAFLLLSIIIFSLGQLHRDRWLPGLSILVAATLALSVTRLPLVAVAVAGALTIFVSKLARLRWFSSFLESRHRNWITNVALGAGVLAIPIAILMAEFVLERTSLRAIGAGISELSDPGQATAVIGASWDFNSTFPGFAYNVLRVLVGPMAWEITNLSLLFFWVEAVFYTLVLLGFCHAVAILKKSRFPLLLTAVASSPVVVAAALVFANYGLNSRVRAHIYLILFLFVEPYVHHLGVKAKLHVAASLRTVRQLAGFDLGIGPVDRNRA